MFRRFLLLGSANAFLAVALGAFGAHTLKTMLDPDSLAVFETGVRYHMMHALGLLALAWLADRWPGSRLLSAAGWLLFAGIVLFSGSLYALSMTGIKAFGPITPLGGVSFLIGWAFVFAAAWKERKRG
jgi:uncharacterized membrane protein YgdD (TMEM256/DUF423 family)